MAIQNPVKKFNFSVEILPLSVALPVFAVQNCNLPDVEIEPVEHGYGNTTVKTAGKVSITNFTLQRILDPNQALGRAFMDWMYLAQNPVTLAGGDPLGIDGYKRMIIVTELQNDGVTPKNSYHLYGCWPTKINGKEFDRLSSDNIMEEIEFACDYMEIV